MDIAHLSAALALAALALGGGPGAGSPPPLPDSISGWHLAERTSFDRTTLFRFIDGGAEVYLAYAFRQVWVATYERPRSPRIAVEVYDMGVPADAYGVLSLDLTGEEVAAGSAARYGAGLLRFWKDRWFVRVLAERESAALREAVLALGAQVARAIPGEAPPPALLRRLPQQGLRPETAAYFHTRMTLNQLYYLADENLLLLGADTEAALADYRWGEERAKLLLVRYPDGARCRRARQGFLRGHLDLTGALPADDPVIVVLEDKRFVGVMAAAPYLVLALEAGSEQSARELLRRGADAVEGGEGDASRARGEGADPP